jgi:enamine deaminase RidA (YjgF/YER057c/UK114 family)
MIEHVNPASMPHHPAFSQATIAPAGRTLYIGGQNGIGPDGQVLEGLEAQTQQALRNVLTILEEAGAGPADVARLAIYLDASVDANEGFAAAAPVWGQHPTAITVLKVAGFGRPGVLVEVEAVAALP